MININNKCLFTRNITDDNVKFHDKYHQMIRGIFTTNNTDHTGNFSTLSRCISFLPLNDHLLGLISNMQGLLSYLIGPDWRSYFDVSIVDAKKPLWFMKGTVFRQIDTVTGAPKIGVHQGTLKKGDVYAGGMFTILKTKNKKKHEI